MRTAVTRLLVVAVLATPAAARANDLHDQLVRQSLALEQAAEGRLAARDSDAAQAAAATLLEPLRQPSAGLDPAAAVKVQRVHELLEIVRAQRAAGRAPAPLALPAPRVLHGADAPGNQCASAVPLHEGEALRLPVSAGARVWLRVAAQGDAPLMLTTRGSTLDPALTAYADCRVADREPLAAADDSLGLQADLGLLPTKQTFWYVRADNLSGAGDFVLSAVRAVSITGRVRRAATGDGIAGVRVGLFIDVGGSYSGIVSSTTDSTGSYTLTYGGGGTFAVRTGDDFAVLQGLVHQSYNGLPCASSYVFDLYTCGTSGNVATPIVLSDGSTQTADFALSFGGSLAGTLTSSLGGPVAGASVRVVLPNGSEVRNATSDALGRWRVDGMPASGVYVVAGSVDHAWSVYPGIECPGQQYFNCNLAAGTQISVPVETLVRADMSLRRQQFVEVEFTLDGAPPPDPAGSGQFVTAVLLNSNGAVIATGSQVSGSRYRIGPIAPGSYRLRAVAPFAYTRLYPAVECASDCIAELGNGEPITVAASDTVVSRTMDLRGYPSIDGTVTTEGNGSAISNATVSLLRVGGNGFENYGTTTNAAGAYRFAAVAPGTYLLRFISNNHIDEVHDNVPCASQNPAVDCPGATLVSVGSSTPDRTIDAALARSATISGRILSNGLPVNSFGALFLVRPDGSVAASWSAFGNADGRYTIVDVTPGTWRVAYLADSFYGFVPQMYPGINCPGASSFSFAGCALGQATAIDVAASAAVTGIDFDLRRTGSQVVRVLYAFDESPLPGVMVDVWNAAGQRVDSRLTDAQGRAYPVGTANSTAAPHALSTDNTAGYINEVYQDIECPNGSVFFGSCALAGYTPVVFPAPQGAPEIILRIARPVPIFGGNFEQ
jgi:hypothetical protein